jgi:hypothetical protein
MSAAIDRMAFPETPEEMYLMLEVEAKIKAFTHLGINGYFLRGGENGAIKGRISLADWHAEGDRSADNTGV